MKQLLKKFKNFRLTAIIEAILGAVVVIAALVLLILYQSNQTRFNPSTGEMINIPGFPGQPLAGMVFFLAGLLAIIFGVVAVYTSLPFIFKKDEIFKMGRFWNCKTHKSLQTYDHVQDQSIRGTPEWFLCYIFNQAILLLFSSPLENTSLAFLITFIHNYL